jgi:multiple sugar transport system substrate-binding protein
MVRERTVRAALVGGPMYDPLYDRLPQFVSETGLAVEVVVQLPHPELNAWVAETFANGEADVDLLSTHTKYAPSQAQWLSPLGHIVPAADLKDLLPRPAEQSHVGGQFLQMPRNVVVRLLHYRTDLLPDPPDTWDRLADDAARVATASVAGFLFPGRDSGLFGTFYELLVDAGGALFDAALSPAFESDAGVRAVAYLTDLHRTRRVTPPALPDWHYDEISSQFRAGRAAMVCDWPGSYHLYRNPDMCGVADRVSLALLPAGSSGIRSAYGGCHSFAIPRASRNPEGGAALLRYLTSFDAQLGEARRGSIPARASALARVREESAQDPAARSRWRMLAESERVMIAPPRFAAYPRCEDAIWRAVQRSLMGEWSPAEAVAHAATDVRRIVSEA